MANKEARKRNGVVIDFIVSAELPLLYKTVDIQLKLQHNFHF